MVGLQQPAPDCSLVDAPPDVEEKTWVAGKQEADVHTYIRCSEHYFLVWIFNIAAGWDRWLVDAHYAIDLQTPDFWVKVEELTIVVSIIPERQW